MSARLNFNVESAKTTLCVHRPSKKQIMATRRGDPARSRAHGPAFLPSCLLLLDYLLAAVVVVSVAMQKRKFTLPRESR
jgi:hypothetical protein